MKDQIRITITADKNCSKEVIDALINVAMIVSKNKERYKRYDFGEVKEYKDGDVVVWRGNVPCIGKIKGRTADKDCWIISDRTHNSLHYHNLRPATQKEKKKLGRNQILLLNP